MKDQRMIEVLAGCAGWTYIGVTADFGQIPIGQPHMSGMTQAVPLPAYLTSHDAMQPLIDVLAEGKAGKHSEYLRYKVELAQVCLPKGVLTLKAKAAEKAEAYLKAKGLWEEGE